MFLALLKWVTYPVLSIFKVFIISVHKKISEVLVFQFIHIVTE
jgi:hypothetical protein